MSERLTRQDAIVFFARDFLAVEFARIGESFSSFQRVFITINEAEAAQVRAASPGAHVFSLYPLTEARPSSHELDTGFNIDRFLRDLDENEIRAVSASVRRIHTEILSSFRVRYYMDEPVSGYPNAEFNRCFSASGAICLHFHPAWVPGYFFFTSDPAQRAPVPLGIMEGGKALAAAHVDLRRAGGGKPLYVLGYGKVRKRVSDWFKTIGKGVYRKLFRRNAPYIDREASEHWMHARALQRSFISRYSPDPAQNAMSKYVIFPLHYEPEAVLGYFSAYTRQEEIAAQLLDALPLGYKLILKEHPSQPGALHTAKWAALRRSPRTVFLRGDYAVGPLMALRPIVVSIGSTFALEAAVSGSVVGLLGGVHFEDAPGMYKLDRPGDWLSLIEKPAAPLDRIVEWYGDFLDRYCFPGSIMRGATKIERLDDIVSVLKQPVGEHASSKKKADMR